MSNLVTNAPDCKKYLQRPNCPFCDYSIVWKHARYRRTGTHSKILKTPPVSKVVQRCLCKSPGCGRTFSVLPEDTLPYCRFGFNDFLTIYVQYQKGLNAYSIWKTCSLIGVSLRTIVRLLSLFKKVLPLMKKLYQEFEGQISKDLSSMCQLRVIKFTMFGVTTRWYHAIYPARLWEIQNPHNLES